MDTIKNNNPIYDEVNERNKQRIKLLLSHVKSMNNAKTEAKKNSLRDEYERKDAELKPQNWTILIDGVN